MNLPITTPALLFPAISLLFLSYNGRFLTLSNLIRGMHAEYHKVPDERILAQMRNFKIRLQLIRWMQWLAMVSFILGAITMFLLYVGLQFVGELLFGTSLLFLVASLGFSLREIHISINALKVLIGDIV